MPSRDVALGSMVARDGHWAAREANAISPTLPAGVRAQGAAGVAKPSARGAVPMPASADFPKGTASVLGVIGTASVAPGSAPRPIVLLATSDPNRLRSFHAWLERRANVKGIEGASALIAALEANRSARIVVVLDGKNPGVRPLTLAALADEMPEQVAVLLWGLPPHVHAKMRGVSARTERWTLHSGDMTTEELVASCAEIVGRAV